MAVESTGISLLFTGVLQILKKQKIDFKLKTKVMGAKKNADGSIEVTVEDAKGKSSTMEADVVLVCVGRRPVTEGLGLENVGASSLHFCKTCTPLV